MSENLKPDSSIPQISLYERVTRERQRETDALDRKLTQLFDRLLIEEKALIGFKLHTEKRFGQLWQWQTAAIVLTLVNFALLLFWRR